MRNPAAAMIARVPQQPPNTRSWLDAVRIYGERPVLSMLFMGFSSGLPFMLVFSTLSLWLRQVGIQRATIGMLSWVGIVYTIKFVWSPIVDRVGLPLLDRLLGRRRGWILFAQAGIAFGLFNMAQADPATSIRYVAVWALWVAFFSTTQDIAVDAWRIESAAKDKQGAMAAAYQLGYRVSIAVASAGAIGLAGVSGWRVSYSTMAALACIGMIITLLVREPQRLVLQDAVLDEQRVLDWLGRNAHLPQVLRQAGGWFVGAVVCPLVDFFSRQGLMLGALIFAFIGSYRLTDFVMGTMANPFYADIGFTNTQIALVAKFFGIAATVCGVIIGGVAVAKLGRVRSLVLGSTMIILSNLSYSLFASMGQASVVGLATIVSIDNLAVGVHGTALIAYLSSLTSDRYTATQYALFASLYALPGKVMMGTSGFVVDAIGYPHFFLYTAALSLPGLALLGLLYKRGAFEKTTAA
jgi:MFS transporter, PAT family, beta-lactamase induction signal transducer AmpG